jgi:hypothetical protein
MAQRWCWPRAKLKSLEEEIKAKGSRAAAVQTTASASRYMAGSVMTVDGGFLLN